MTEAKTQVPDEGPPKRAAEAKAPLLAAGIALRRMRGGVTGGVGALLAFVLMAHDGQLSFGVPLGVVFVLVATWGIMDLLGTFDDPAEHVANRTTPGALLRPLAYAGLAFFGLCLSLWGGQSGV